MSDWHTILAIDFDPKAVETYRLNVEADRVLCGSVADLVATLPPCDVLLGGPPCQGFSHAGKRKGKDDARDCVPDFIAAIKRVKPRQFLMENVEGFTTIEGGRYMQRAMAQMEALGYRVEMRLLDAVNFGVPQFRLRCWFWGIRNDVPSRHCWPKPTHTWPHPETACMFGGDLLPAVTTGMALGLAVYDAQNEKSHDEGEPCGTIQGNHANALPKVEQYRWSDQMLQKHPPASPASPASPAPTVQAKWFKGGAEGLVAIRRPRNFKGSGGCVRRDHPIGEPSPMVDARHGGSGLHGVLSADGRVERAPSATVTNGGTDTGGADPITHAKRQGYVRRLTPDECARLQSMPNDFKWPESVAKTHRYRIIGNGWASLMAKRMGEALKAADPKSRTVVDLFCGGGCGAVGWHGLAWEFNSAAAPEARE